MTINNTRVAIIGALPEEVQSIRKLGNEITKRQSGPFTFEEFDYNGLNCLLSITGIGKVQAAMLFQHIVDTWQPDYFIFTGVAGALNPKYDTGDIVIGTEFIQHDLELNALGFERGEIPYTGEKVFAASPLLLNIADKYQNSEHKVFRGRILTGDQFITHDHIEPYFSSELKGDAVEMEGAVLAVVASRNKIPFIVLRTISDRADGNAACDFNTLLPIVGQNSVQLVEHLLKSLADSAQVSKNYVKVSNDIAESAKNHNRNTSEIQLLTVTKNHPAEKIHCLYRNGICEFAENRVQELKEKAAILPQDIHWHLIGPLQSNKVRQAVQVAKTIHSVDNEALAQRISRIAVEEKKNINIFIQVNITGEIQKSGVSTISLEKVLKSCSQLPNIKLSGLMTMGPLSATREDNIATFQTLKDLSIKYKAYFDSKPTLSMGMSADFDEAISCGSNILRIGSAIMGRRNYEN